MIKRKTYYAILAFEIVLINGFLPARNENGSGHSANRMISVADGFSVFSVLMPSRGNRYQRNG